MHLALCIRTLLLLNKWLVYYWGYFIESTGRNVLLGGLLKFNASYVIHINVGVLDQIFYSKQLFFYSFTKLFIIRKQFKVQKKFLPSN